MIKMFCDPILGVRYVSVDVEPRIEENSIIQNSAKEKFARANNSRATQMRKAQNTKSK